MASFNWPPVTGGSGGSGIATYTSFSNFPASPVDGQQAIALDTDTLYVYNLGSVSWIAIASPSSQNLSVGALDAQTPNVKGLALVAGVLSQQSATDVYPGLMTTAAQSFAGVKTFESAPNLSSLTASLPLQLDASKNIVSTAINLSGTQATGTLAAARMPALTGDVTTTAGTVATSLVATSNATLTTLSGLTTANSLTSASSLATVGTISTGVWAGTNIAIAHGGTGAASTSQNFAFIGPTSGSGAPSFRALVGGDLPLPQAAVMGGVFSKAAVSHQFLTAIVAADGSVTSAQPAFTDISGSVAAAQLPNPSASTLGGVQSAAAVSHQWINSISTSGVPALSQPAFSDISGSVAASQLPNPSASTLGGIESYAAVSHQWINTISTSGVPASSQPAFTDISGTIGVSQVTAPTVQKFTSTGTQTGWLFNISTSTTCAVGDTYTNNGHTFTVQGALSAQSGFVLFVSGTGSTTTSGTDTLARSSGAGTSSITFNGSTKIASATYSTPANTLWMRVRQVGAGGGGGGSGQSNGGAGATGGSTYFGPNILTANGGLGGTGGAGAGGNPPAGGGGGTASFAGGTCIAFTGQTGATGQLVGVSTSVDICGGTGGSSFFSGAGQSGSSSSLTGTNAIANTGSGGGGGSFNNTGTAAESGAGGGSGGFLDAIITSPAVTYPYIIGTGGSGGSAGTNGGAGGNGAAGIIMVEEFYQ